MQNVKETFIKLLEEDKEFRFTVAGILGYRNILERLEEHDRKFNEVLSELREHRKLLEEHDRKFNEVLSELREHRKLLEEHDRKFNEIVEEIKLLRENFENLYRRVEVTIGSMGRRWGRDLERIVLEIFKEALERRGIKIGKVESFRYVDVTGEVSGRKGTLTEVDVVVKDDKLYLIEVKSHAEVDHVERLHEKREVVEKVLNKTVEKMFIVAVNIDEDAYERAKEMGIEVICGDVIK